MTSERRMMRTMPKAWVSAMEISRMSMPPEPSTAVSSRIAPGLFSRNTEICLINMSSDFLSHSFLRSTTCLALPSNLGMDLGATSVTFVAMPTTDLTLSTIFLRTASMSETVSENISSVIST